MAKKYLDQQGLQTLIQGLKAKNDALYAKAAHGHAANEVSYKNANIKGGADIKVNEALDVLVANVIRASEDLSTTDGNVKELEKAINALKAQVGEGTVVDKIQAVQNALNEFKATQATKDQEQDAAIGAAQGDATQALADAATAQQAANDAAAAVETEKGRAEGVEQGLQDAIDGMKDAQNGILAQAKSYADQKDGELHTAISAEIDADVKVVADNLTAEISRAQTAEKKNADAIAAINNADTGILKQAKDYADGKDAAIAAAKSAADAAQADVDALEGKVGEVPADKTVIGLIGEAKAQADKGVADAAAEAGRAQGVEAELRADLGQKGDAAAAEGSAFARIAQVKADLAAEVTRADAAEKAALKAGQDAQKDVDALETLVGDAADTKDDATVYGAIAAEKARAEAAEGAIDAKAEANKSAIATLNGADTVEGSVANKIKTAIDQVNTAAAGLGDRVDALEGKVGSDADAAKADGSLYARVKQNANEIGAIKADYLKAADKTALQNAINVEKGRLDAFMANADVSAQAVDTLKEIQDYITSDGQAAAQMTKDIAANKTAIAAINHETTGILAQAKADAAAKDEVLHTAITGEIATAKTEAISVAASDADSKVGAAKTELQGKIDKKADQTELQAEIDRAKAAEAANKAVLDKLDGDVNTDGSVKKQIEAVRFSLQGNIDGKVAQDAYNTKVAALEAADTALGGRLNTIEGEGEGSIKKALADAKAHADAEDAKIEALLGTKADAASADTAFGKIANLQAQIDDITPVTEQEITNMLNTVYGA